MPLLEVKDLHTFFTTKKGIVKAVNGVSYSLEAGKTIGIVGESGSGKSVSAMSILQLLDGKSDAFGQLTHHFGDLDISPVHLGAEGLRLHAGGNHRHGEETEHHGQGEQQCKQFFLHCMFLPVQM